MSYFSNNVTLRRCFFLIFYPFQKILNRSKSLILQLQGLKIFEFSRQNSIWKVTIVLSLLYIIIMEYVGVFSYFFVASRFLPKKITCWKIKVFLLENCYVFFLSAFYDLSSLIFDDYPSITFNFPTIKIHVKINKKNSNF